MRIALAQISPHLGNIQKNFELHVRIIEKARREKAQLLIFPELSLTGYLLKDLVETVALDADRSPIFKEFKALSRDISLVLGFVEEKPREKGLFYNSAVFLDKGKILHIHRKVFLPTSGMFEEGRFFAQGRNFGTFPAPCGNTGLLICRDFLHYGASYLLFAGGSEVILVISAAPGRGLAGKNGFATSRMWELMGEAISRFSSAFVIYCNRVGLEDGIVFAGGSFIFNPFGKRLVQAPYFERNVLFHELDLDEIRRARKNWPFKRDDKPEVILHALKRIVHDFND
jgi:predicted amidohydrolase